MAGSLLALLDDVVSLLDDVALMAKSAASKTGSMMDDVALMTKSATGKTAGVLGDDLAVSATQLTGIASARELPILWQVAKGSLVNKAIIVPIALLLNAFLPFLLNWVLLAGGAFLCFEGVEKLLHRGHEQPAAPTAAVSDAAALEKEKICGAVKTDFILSIEIVVIALSDLMARQAGLALQIVALSIIAVLITFLVYGVVAVIVKLDDLGFYLHRRGKGWAQYLGSFLLWLAPQLVRFLSWAGLVAIFLVGGHIWQEHTPLHHWQLAHWLWGNLLTIAVGLAVGLISSFGYKLLRPDQ